MQLNLENAGVVEPVEPAWIVDLEVGVVPVVERYSELEEGLNLWNLTLAVRFVSMDLPHAVDSSAAELGSAVRFASADPWQPVEVYRAGCFEAAVLELLGFQLSPQPVEVIVAVAASVLVSLSPHYLVLEILVNLSDVLTEHHD